MNKTILLVLGLSMAVLQGCNSSSPTTTESGQNEESSEIIQQVANEEGEINAVPIPMTIEDFLIKVMNFEENPEEWNFEGDIPCIVDFYADWCPPCRISNPILEELAATYAGKINIYKVDVDVEQELAAIFGVQSIPSFLFVPMEGLPTMTSGIASTEEETKEMFVRQIEMILLNDSVSAL